MRGVVPSLVTAFVVACLVVFALTRPSNPIVASTTSSTATTDVVAKDKVVSINVGSASPTASRFDEFVTRCKKLQLTHTGLLPRTTNSRGAATEFAGNYSYFRPHVVETMPVCLVRPQHQHQQVHLNGTAGSHDETNNSSTTMKRGSVLWFTDRTEHVLFHRSRVIVNGNVYGRRDMNTALGMFHANLRRHTTISSETSPLSSQQQQQQQDGGGRKGMRKEGDVVYHESMAVINAGWFNYHMFHCLIDALLPVNALEADSPTFRQIPKSMVWVSNLLVNKLDVDSDRPPWPITLELLRRLSADETIVTLRKPGVDTDDHASHCYCGAVVAHSVPYRLRAEIARREAAWQSGMRGARLQIDRLVEAFGLPPHGREPYLPIDAVVKRLQAYRGDRKDGAYFWTWNESAIKESSSAVKREDPTMVPPHGRPRLTIIQRAAPDRRLYPEDFVKLAWLRGMEVAVVHTEQLSIEQQVAMMRFTDVLVAVHGAGATLQMFMDAAGINANCRTWIELVPWAPRYKLPVMMQQSLLSTIGYVALEASDIHFAASVPMVTRRKALRVRKSAAIGAFEYLRVPHTLKYDEHSIGLALDEAIGNWNRCGSSSGRMK